MHRQVAFLRAINVGGRNVKMDVLKRVFDDLGFSGVSSYLASGNILFSARSECSTGLRQRIEAALHKELGYPVDTFLRSPEQMRTIAQRTGELRTKPGIQALNVGFCATAFSTEAIAEIQRWRSALDDFDVDGAEIYWSCACMQSDSKFEPGKLERKLGLALSFRNANTVTQVAALLAAP